MNSITAGQTYLSAPLFYKRQYFNMFIYTISIFTLLIIFALNSSAQEIPIDQFLLNKGVPSDVLAELNEIDKEFLYQNLSPESTFDDYTVQTITIPAKTGNITPYGMPSSSTFVFSLLTFNEPSSGGYARMSFFPTFKWNQKTTVKNDVFGFSLPTGWYAEEAKQNLNVQGINDNGQVVAERSISYTSHNGFGSVYKLPSDCGTTWGRYQGNAVMYGQKRSSSAPRSIYLDYIDNNSGLPISISFGIGPLSISWEPFPATCTEWNKTFYF